MAMLKERRWELMEVGERFGPTFVTVDDRLVRNFAYAVDDFEPVCQPSAAGEARYGQPTLLCREARDVIATAYDIASGGAGMHAKHECEIFGRPRIGETYRITGSHIEKYLKREKQYIVLESYVHDTSGKLLLKQRSTHIRALKPGVAKSTPTLADNGEAPPPPEIEFAETQAELRPGIETRPLTKTFNQEHLTVFAGTDWPNIHNAPEVAKGAGLRGTVASGLQTMAFISEIMGRYCGAGWREGGKLAVAFTAPLFVDETVTARILVKDISQEIGRRRLHAEVRCDTAAGARVLAGTASAWLP